MNGTSTRGFAAVVALVVSVTVAACSGGGGGGGGGPTTPPPPVRMITWTGDGVAGEETLYLEIRDLSNPDEFVLQLRAKQVTDLYGVALDIVFPATRLDFLEAVEGSFFPGGNGLPTELQVVEEPDGRIIIGHSRIGDERGRTGSGVLLELSFRTTANGSSLFEIERQQAIDRDGGQLSAQWLGGTVQVQR